MELSTAHHWNLAEWLAFIAKVHVTRIELGLTRVRAVAERLQLLQPACPVIIVGGTNGKGSTVAGLNALYLAAGYQVGTFTSPYLLRYNEEITINNESVNDHSLCQAFSHIEAARHGLPLTVFEYSTLAALFIFKQYPLDVIILEVGLGGRLDAVNIIDADVAVITSVGIDHTEWLGNTREQIAQEKAGIFRTNRPAVCGDSEAPLTLLQTAEQLNVPLYTQGQAFNYQEGPLDWSWQTTDTCYSHLPYNALLTQNMATVLMTIHSLQSKLPVTEYAIINGLSHLMLPGRIQVIPGAVLEIYDVAHNPDAIKKLKEYLHQTKKLGRTYAVFSMLTDKAITESITLLKTEIDYWYVGEVKAERAASLQKLKQCFTEVMVGSVNFYPEIETAYLAAKRDAVPGDRIVICGSFYVVGACFHKNSLALF